MMDAYSFLGRTDQNRKDGDLSFIWEKQKCMKFCFGMDDESGHVLNNLL